MYFPGAYAYAGITEGSYVYDYEEFSMSKRSLADGMMPPTINYQTLATDKLACGSGAGVPYQKTCHNYAANKYDRGCQIVYQCRTDI